MQYRKMGRSDLEVSTIGFGCWEMGGTQYGEVDDQEEVRAVHRAIDLGVTLFDTAAIYGPGHSEEVLGRALGARRREVVLVTKGGLIWDGLGRGSSRRDSSYWALTQGLEASLHRLRTDYVDLFLIHWPDVNTPMEEAARALNDLVKAGKTRYVGVSNFSADQLRAIKRHVLICANQVGYNLFDRRWEREMFATARELGIGVMAYGPMAHGLLTGTFTRDTKFVDWDWRSRGSAFGQALFSADNFPRNVEVADRLKVVAERLGTTLPKLAIAWVLANPAVSVALSGTRRPAEIEHNVGALDARLSDADLREIDQIMTGAAGQVDAIPT
jgi:aryl-alcohol dehydrogenase-like predicted oxidoreductase